MSDDDPIPMKQKLPAAMLEFFAIWEKATLEQQMAIVRALEPSR